jgi:CheY-like chemotaxis protein
VNQPLAVRLLEKLGHTVVVAPDGQAALAALQQAAFDLVLMDVQMPVMGGLAATAAIRAQEQASGAHIPSIAMTAHAMQGDRDGCLAAGMDDYLAKPIHADELYAVIARVVASQPHSHPSSQASPIDLPAALANVDGDRARLIELTKTFLEDGPRQLAGLHEAIRAADAPAAQRAAHSLKGPSVSSAPSGRTTWHRRSKGWPRPGAWRTPPGR